MNILRAVTLKRDTPESIKKLQNRSCDVDSTCSVKYSKEELRSRLTPLQYHVTQEKATEREFSGQFVQWTQEGIFTCVVCGNNLFTSDTKFDSRSGWPSFSDVIQKGQVRLKEDTAYGLTRTEVKCSDCNAHLGHVFDDGPKPNGIRYCVNSASLDFKKHTTV